MRSARCSLLWLATATLTLLVAVALLANSCHAATNTLQPGQYHFNLTSNLKLGMRHCDFELYVTPYSPLPDDFLWVVTPALNGNASAVSIMSSNYPGQYIATITTEEAFRLGVVNNPDPQQASFVPVPGAVAGSFSFMASASANAFIGINNHLQGGCSSYYQPPASDLALVLGPDTEITSFTLSKVATPSVALVVNPKNVTHKVNPFFMGCHSDSGFMHQARGFYSQMIIGESFESTTASVESTHWNLYFSDQGSASIVSGGMHGQNALSISRTKAGKDLIGASNRGLGNEGLYLEANRNYEGYFFAKADAPVTVKIALQDIDDGSTFASQSIQVEAGNWTQYTFNMTTNAAAPCIGYQQGMTVNCGNLPNSAHICVKCAAQAFIGLQSIGSVMIDYVFVQPGSWARLDDLPVLNSSISVLKSMGVTLIRQGGSFTIGDYYSWKNWRGAPWARPSVGAVWQDELISGWGPFEMIDMCNAAGIEPAVTISADSGSCCSAEDMADLVEYCYGDNSTTWGALRHSDGHPQPYKVKIFELGNEQYNHNYADQVTAMEKRAAALGMANTLFYMNPNNGHWLNATDAAKVEALGIKDNAVMDFHVGAGGAVEAAEAMFQANPTLTMGAVNAETNAANHEMRRALTEASDLNDWFSCSEEWCSRLHFRTASFCTERSGHADAYDQGISFFLPNMTWLQPPGYVHKMISDTWYENGVEVAANASTVSFSVQASDDGSQLVVRLSNANPVPIPVSIYFKAGSFSSTVSVSLLTAPSPLSRNTPSEPKAVSPTKATVDFSKSNNTYTMPPLAVAMLTFHTT